jgi:hypothetical protein
LAQSVPSPIQVPPRISSQTDWVEAFWQLLSEMQQAPSAQA